MAEKRRAFILDIVGDYKQGDPPPSGYLQWQEWARIQDRAGLKQRFCGGCRKWKFPQEFPCSCGSTEEPLTAKEFKTMAAQESRSV